jgi:hypothetical protein
MKKFYVIIAIAGLVLLPILLSGCGKTGVVETPAPIVPSSDDMQQLSEGLASFYEVLTASNSTSSSSTASSDSETQSLSAQSSGYTGPDASGWYTFPYDFSLTINSASFKYDGSTKIRFLDKSGNALLVMEKPADLIKVSTVQTNSLGQSDKVSLQLALDATYSIGKTVKLSFNGNGSVNFTSGFDLHLTKVEETLEIIIEKSGETFVLKNLLNGEILFTALQSKYTGSLTLSTDPTTYAVTLSGLLYYNGSQIGTISYTVEGYIVIKDNYGNEYKVYT